MDADGQVAAVGVTVEGRDEVADGGRTAHHWPARAAPMPARFITSTPTSARALTRSVSVSAIHASTWPSPARSAALPPLTSQQMRGVPVMSPQSLPPVRARRSTDGHQGRR